MIIEKNSKSGPTESVANLESVNTLLGHTVPLFDTLKYLGSLLLLFRERSLRGRLKVESSLLIVTGIEDNISTIIAIYRVFHLRL